MAATKKKLSALQYSLDTFHRSNQDTSLVHKPTVFEGDWVQPGDLLADCSASEGGELALGHNILVAYMPWEGYNFEDAILISEKLVYDDVFTSIHIERYETETRQTKLGAEKITRELPEITGGEVKHLDSSGIAKIGSWVEEGDILVGKITPLPEKVQSPSQKFLYKLLDKKFKPIRDSSLRAPKSIKSKVIKIEVFSSAPMDLNPKGVEKHLNTSRESSKKKDNKKNALPLSFNSGRGEHKSKGMGYDIASLSMHSKTQLSTAGIKTNIRASEKLDDFTEFGSYPFTSAKLNSLPYSFAPSEANNQHNKKKKFDFATTIIHNSLGFVPNIKPPTKLSTKVRYLSTKIHQQLYLKRMSLFMCKRTVGRDLVGAVGFPAAATLGSRLYTGPSLQVNSICSLRSINKLFDRVNNYYTHNRASLKKNPKQIPVKSIILYPTVGNQILLALPTVLQTKLTHTLGTTIPVTANRGSGLLLKKDTINLLRRNTRAIPFSKQILRGSRLVRDVQNNGHPLRENGLPKKSYIPVKIQIYLAEKRKIQVGDKMAGRHGNKGIISQILPRQDMPYLPDGTPVDIVLNPLGVPSRMNVGQIYECLLGLAGKYLGQHFKIFPFDEIYGPEASRSFVYSKLYEARQKTGLKWLFNPNTPGKLRLFDGRTGDSFEQPITVGRAYMLKLVHMVDDKIHARSTGPYSLVTQQPLRGRSKQGGQRLGEMEVWAIEGYGAAFTLLEMLTIKSDDMTGRMTLWHNLIFNKEISIGTPESFKVLICELQALCLDIGLFKKQ